MINLVGNAIKFSKPGDTITIQIRKKGLHFDSENTFEISVTDMGLGLNDEDRRTIF